MDVKNFEIEQGLRDLYCDPKTGYQSVERLYQKAREDGLRVSRKVVKEWVKTQKTYTKFKPIVRRHKFQRTFVKDFGQVQMDLVDMQKYSYKNENYNWILTGIEIFSRYGFAIPVLRKETQPMRNAVKKLLNEYEEKFGKQPDVVQFDEGKEFYNVGVRNLLSVRGICYFSTYSERKAAVVERFNRTLKTSMWKYFDKNSTKHWLDILDDLVYNYNHSKHSSTKMKPADVNEENKEQAWLNLFGYGVGEFPDPKFKVGDTVRISKYKNIFKKGYEQNFTDEIFSVTKVFRGDPNMYEIVDEDNESIHGKFYEQEMSHVRCWTRGY